MAVKSIRLSFLMIMISLGLLFTGCEKTVVINGTSDDTTGTSTTATATYGTVSGRITLDETPTVSESLRLSYATTSTDSKLVFYVTAYNINDGTTYQTTTNDEGDYLLSGLTTGQYQITATNPAYAKSGARVVTVSRTTNVVVNVSLEAIATISGMANGATQVSVVGSSYVSDVGPTGAFKLDYVPVGTVWLKFLGELSAETSNDSSSGTYTTETSRPTLWRQMTIAAGVNEFTETINFERTQVSLLLPQHPIPMALHNSGFWIYMTGDVPMSAVAEGFSVTQVDETGSFIANIPVKIDWTESAYNEGKFPAFSNVWMAKTVNLIEPGYYKVRCWGVEQTWQVYDAVASFIDPEMDVLTYIFGSPLDASTDYTAEISITDSSSNPVTFTAAINNQDFNIVLYRLSLYGDFKLGETYDVTFSDQLKTDMGITDDTRYYRVADEDVWEVDSADAFTYDIPNPYFLGGTSPFDGAKAIGINSSLGGIIVGRNGVDVTSIVYQLSELDSFGGSAIGTSTFTASQLTLANWESCTNNDCDLWLMINLNGQTLSFDTPYRLTMTADNIDGISLTPRSVDFKTVDPAIVRVEPTWDFYPSKIDSLYRAFFNVQVDPSSDYSVVVEDSLGTPVSTTCDWWNDYQAIACTPATVEADTAYTITFSGFDALDDTADTLADATFTWRSPPQFLHSTYPENGDVSIDPSAENQGLIIFVSGELSTAQMADVSSDIKVYANGSEVSADSVQIVHIAEMTDTTDVPIEVGSAIIVGFAYEIGTTYKVGFDSVPASVASLFAEPFVTFKTTGISTPAVAADKDVAFTYMSDGNPAYQLFSYQNCGLYNVMLFELALADPMTQENYYFDTSTDSFVVDTSSSSSTSYYLDASGDWMEISTGQDALTGKSVNAGTYTVSYSSPQNATLTMQAAYDLSGSTQTFGNDGFTFGGIMSSGAEKYSVGVVVDITADNYVIYDEYYSNNSTGPFGSIDAFLTDAVDNCFEWTASSTCYRLNYSSGDSSGDVDEYTYDSSSDAWSVSTAGIGSWESDTVNGVELVRVDLPNVEEKGMTDALFAMNAGSIWKGYYELAGTTQTMELELYNDIAKSDVEGFLAALEESAFGTYMCGSSGDAVSSDMLTAYVSNGLVAPNGGETWTTGTYADISWSTSELIGTSADIYLLFDDPSSLDSTPDSATVASLYWAPIVTGVTVSDGTYSYDTSGLSSSGSAYRLLIVTDAGYWDFSDGNFSIDSGSGYEVSSSDLFGSHYASALTSPAGGETWNDGDSVEITWSYTDLSGTYGSIYILYDDPSSLDTSADSPTDVAALNWVTAFSNVDMVTETTGTFDPSFFGGSGDAYRVLIVSDSGNWAVSGGNFSLNYGTQSNPMVLNSGFNSDNFDSAETHYYVYQLTNTDVSADVEPSTISPFDIYYYGTDSTWTTAVDWATSQSSTATVGETGLSSGDYIYFYVTSAQAGSTDIIISDY